MYLKPISLKTIYLIIFLLLSVVGCDKALLEDVPKNETSPISGAVVQPTSGGIPISGSTPTTGSGCCNAIGEDLRSCG